LFISKTKQLSSSDSCFCFTNIITGGNSGLGFSTAAVLLKDKENFHVVIACRDRVSGELAVKKLQRTV